MRVACLIQGDSWVALNNLPAPDNGASNLTADLADQNVSPKIGDAILVIDGEEFDVHVVALTESRIIFEAVRSDEKKNFFNPWSCKHIRFTRESDFLKTPTQNDEPEPMNIIAHSASKLIACRT